MHSDTTKTCLHGHKFTKSSDCPVCPICEAHKETPNKILSAVGAPARRALEREGIVTLSHLASYSEEELLSLHGIGPSSIPRLREILCQAGMSFKASH